MAYRGDASQMQILQASCEALGLSCEQLWIAYFGIGGNHPPNDLESWLAGTARPSAFEYDLVAQAINERFVDHGLTSRVVPYSSDI